MLFDVEYLDIFSIEGEIYQINVYKDRLGSIQTLRKHTFWLNFNPLSPL